MWELALHIHRGRTNHLLNGVRASSYQSGKNKTKGSLDYFAS